MKFADEGEELDGDLMSSVMGGKSAEVSPFGIPVNYNHNDSMAL